MIVPRNISIDGKDAGRDQSASHKAPFERLVYPTLLKDVGWRRLPSMQEIFKGG